MRMSEPGRSTSPNPLPGGWSPFCPHLKAKTQRRCQNFPRASWDLNSGLSQPVCALGVSCPIPWGRETSAGRNLPPGRPSLSFGGSIKILPWGTRQGSRGA